MRLTDPDLSTGQGKPPDCVGGIPMTQSWGFRGVMIVTTQEPHATGQTMMSLSRGCS